MEYLNLLLSSVWLPNLIDRRDDGYAVSLLLELLLLTSVPPMPNAMHENRCPRLKGRKALTLVARLVSSFESVCVHTAYTCLQSLHASAASIFFPSSQSCLLDTVPILLLALWLRLVREKKFFRCHVGYVRRMSGFFGY
jgi:hypothetical protein